VNFNLNPVHVLFAPLMWLPSRIGNILLNVSLTCRPTCSDVTRLSYNSLGLFHWVSINQSINQSLLGVSNAHREVQNHFISMSSVISAITDTCNGQQEMWPNGSRLMANVSVLVRRHSCADSSYDRRSAYLSRQCIVPRASQLIKDSVTETVTVETATSAACKYMH